MLKSLYFKLDDNNEKHKYIIDFFEYHAKTKNKIDILKDIIDWYVKTKRE